jgi:hypothetical protein
VTDENLQDVGRVPVRVVATVDRDGPASIRVVIDSSAIADPPILCSTEASVLFDDAGDPQVLDGRRLQPIAWTEVSADSG